MSRHAIYGNTRLLITDDSITPNQVRDSMTQLFPELRGATIIEKKDAGCIELYLIPLSRVKQHQLDIENTIRSTERLDKKLQDVYEIDKTIFSVKTGTIKPNQITAGWPDKGSTPGDRDSKRQYTDVLDELKEQKRKRKRTFDAQLSAIQTKFAVPSEYVHDILGKYASRGSYEHLVGKKAKIISENTDLEIYTIEVEGDDKQYVIRTKDIQKR